MDSFTVASFLHLGVRVCLVAAIAVGIVALGERALGFSIKGAIDDIEKESRKGNVWPITTLLIGGMAVVGYLLG